MNKLIEWRHALWTRSHAEQANPGNAGCASVLSRERIRELDQPTWMRRHLSIAGISDGVRIGLRNDRLQG